MATVHWAPVACSDRYVPGIQSAFESASCYISCQIKCKACSSAQSPATASFSWNLDFISLWFLYWTTGNTQDLLAPLLREKSQAAYCPCLKEGMLVLMDF